MSKDKVITISTKKIRDKIKKRYNDAKETVDALSGITDGVDFFVEKGVSIKELFFGSEDDKDEDKGIVIEDGDSEEDD